jgi:hypothetical protein
MKSFNGRFSAQACFFSLLTFVNAFPRAGLCADVPVIGAEFADSAVHSVPPNIVASESIFVHVPTVLGAKVSNGSRLQILSNGLVDVGALTATYVTGVQLFDNANLSIAPGGRLDVSEFGGGAIVGLQVQESSQASSDGAITLIERAIGDSVVADVSGTGSLVLGGTSTASETGNGSVYGFRVSESGTASITGIINLSEDGNHDAVGFSVADSGAVDFTGTLNVTEEGYGDAFLLLAEGHGQVKFAGALHVRERGNSAFAGALITGDARFDMTDGLLALDSDGNSLLAPIVMLQLDDQASARIAGGSIQLIEDGVSRIPLVHVNDKAQLRIVGHDFNRPLGPVAEASGVIMGTLAGGQAFAVEFSRTPLASIILVPEPVSAILGIVALAGVAATYRGQRTKR